MSGRHTEFFGADLGRGPFTSARRRRLMDNSPASRVAAIAVRTAVDGPMREIQRAVAAVDGGVDGDLDCAPDRGITFISSQQWLQVVRELGAELPWHTRRANVLVDAPELAYWIGKTIRVGGVEVAVKAETKPCGLMDQLHRGLKDALVPECRGSGTVAYSPQAL